MNWSALIETQWTLGPVPQSLKDVGDRQETKTGEILFRLGARPKSIFYVISGEVQLLRRSRNGQEIILQRSRTGFVAEASMYAPTYHCDAVVCAGGFVWCCPLNTFKAALANDPVFHRAWSEQLARELRKSRAQCERLSLKTATERILHYLETEGIGGAITLRQSRKAWATDLGLTHESLYRTLRHLQSNGVLQIDRDQIAIKP